MAWRPAAGRGSFLNWRRFLHLSLWMEACFVRPPLVECRGSAIERYLEFAPNSFVFFLFAFYLQENVAAVNEALSELYIEDEDHEKLRESVDDYDNFDQVLLCMPSSIVPRLDAMRSSS